jgi:hypothetical protein
MEGRREWGEGGKTNGASGGIGSWVFDVLGGYL